MVFFLCRIIIHQQLTINSLIASLLLIGTIMNLKRLKPAPFSHRILIPAVFQLLGLILLIASSGCSTLNSRGNHQNHQDRHDAVTTSTVELNTESARLSNNRTQLAPPYPVPVIQTKHGREQQRRTRHGVVPPTRCATVIIERTAAHTSRLRRPQV